LHDFSKMCSRSTSGSLLQWRISDAASPKRSGGGDYCRRRDLSTATLMLWARHLLSPEDLRKRAENGNSAGKAQNVNTRRSIRSSARGFSAIATACVRTANRLLFAFSRDRGVRSNLLSPCLVLGSLHSHLRSAPEQVSGISRPDWSRELTNCGHTSKLDVNFRSRAVLVIRSGDGGVPF